MSSFKQSLMKKIIGHKYAIDAKRLGDESEMAWSNLGYWQEQSQKYPRACQMLADQLAQAVQLRKTDRLLDLGCGQGASLLHWLNHYQIEQLTAVELQAECVEKIQKFLPQVESYFGSFLDLQSLKFSDHFNVVMCIDAAYHSALPEFLQSISSVLKPSGRLGFHTLLWSDAWQKSTLLNKNKYRYLLKSADVNSQQIVDKSQLIYTLEQHGFSDVLIQDFSEPVLNGFAEYIETRTVEKKFFDLAELKIQLTAKLCRKLYKDGLIRYVQVSAVKTSQ
ncbi:MAG: class I SAM-dependent methyltransferase [Acinetobacter sp.]